jgi:hypothetical protein
MESVFGVSLISFQFLANVVLLTCRSPNNTTAGKCCRFSTTAYFKPLSNLDKGLKCS